MVYIWVGQKRDKRKGYIGGLLLMIPSLVVYPPGVLFVEEAHLHISLRFEDYLPVTIRNIVFELFKAGLKLCKTIL